MGPQQKRSKKYGYDVEVAALKALEPMFPGIKRTGSTAYTKAAADLVRPGNGMPIRLVVTRDKRRPLLVTMLASDLETALAFPDLLEDADVYVQVKGREKTWIGRLWDELREATS